MQWIEKGQSAWEEDLSQDPVQADGRLAQDRAMTIELALVSAF